MNPDQENLNQTGVSHSSEKRSSHGVSKGRSGSSPLGSESADLLRTSCKIQEGDEHKVRNSCQNELNKFKPFAATWWDPNGELKSLHDINPLRFSFITDNASLSGKSALDVGCGGGLLTEKLAKAGADTYGVDANKEMVDIARLHALESELQINYFHGTAETFAGQGKQFDIITCMELLEHVPHPMQLLSCLSGMLKPGGKLFVSTINRNPKAYMMAIVAAEHILKLLPKGTHEYDKLIKPSELKSWCNAAELNLKLMQGISYNPFTKNYRLTQDISVNYLAYVKKY